MSDSEDPSTPDTPIENVDAVLPNPAGEQPIVPAVPPAAVKFGLVFNDFDQGQAVCNIWNAKIGRMGLPGSLHVTRQGSEAVLQGLARRSDHPKWLQRVNELAGSKKYKVLVQYVDPASKVIPLRKLDASLSAFPGTPKQSDRDDLKIGDEFIEAQPGEWWKRKQSWKEESNVSLDNIEGSPLTQTQAEQLVNRFNGDSENADSQITGGVFGPKKIEGVTVASETIDADDRSALKERILQKTRQQNPPHDSLVQEGIARSFRFLLGSEHVQRDKGEDHVVKIFISQTLDDALKAEVTMHETAIHAFLILSSAKVHVYLPASDPLHLWWIERAIVEIVNEQGEIDTFSSLHSLGEVADPSKIILHRKLGYYDDEKNGQ